MSIRPTHLTLSVTLLYLLSACVTASGSGAPRLRSAHLARVTLDSLTPRELTLRVSDARMPKPANSDTMVARLDRAMRTVLTSSSVTISDSASNALAIDVRYPETSMRGFSTHDCVIIHGVLRLKSGTTASSSGEACFVFRNLYGMRLASDSKGAFESAINEMLAGISSEVDGTAGQ